MLTHSRDTTRDKRREVLVIAQNLYHQKPDWVTYFREVLGLDGIVRRAFTTEEEMAEFEASEEHEEIQKLLTKLRERRGVAEKQTEPTRVITVRIPKSMHELLLDEAKTRSTSMNKLCISKLLQVIDGEFVPTPPPSSRGRRKQKQQDAAPPQPEAQAATGSPPNGMPPVTHPTHEAEEVETHEPKKDAGEDL